MTRLTWIVSALALALLSGCVGNRSLGPGQACPCAPGWSCDSATNTCVLQSNKACDSYFAAAYLRCGGPILPADEATRIRGRFEQVCANEIALPGSGVTTATLQACTDALNASGCEFPAGWPPACTFKGSLPGGTPCTDPLQCQSGFCQGQGSITPGGQSESRACGVCEAVANVGEACNTAGCATGVCITQDTTASMPTYTCTAVVQGKVGASCDDLTALCEPGLYCAAQTGTCTPLGGPGAPCGEGPTVPGVPGGCLSPLACAGPAGAAVCALSESGGSCARDLDCASGWACSSQSGQCGPVTWANPGQPCGDTVRCLVGTCGVVGGTVTGTCPTVVPDGQPCSGGTCDTFSECFGGTCRLLDSVLCG